MDYQSSENVISKVIKAAKSAGDVIRDKFSGDKRMVYQIDAKPLILKNYLRFVQESQ